MSAEVCIVGAGSSGIAAGQVLTRRGIAFDCFELGSEVGGNWRYRNDNGLSAAYRSLHINTSRRLMEFAAHPMPDDLPDFPSHEQIAAYFDEVVDRFGFRDRIRFRTEVVRVAPDGDGWAVTVRDRDGGPERTTGYRAVLVANGHHWDPRGPEPEPEGRASFTGQQLHAHGYDTPDVLAGRRVLVVGIGNSAADIAVEASRLAERTLLSMRRGAHVIPKYVLGRPMDEIQARITSRIPVPVALQRLGATAILRLVQGRMSDYGLPDPDHRLLEAHPTISSELLGRIGHGDIAVRGEIDRFTGGRRVRFRDGREDEVDLVVWCTGYRIRFPFLDRSVVDPQDNRVSLYHRVVPPERAGLFFIGLLQPVGAVMPLAEAQAEWVADLLEGRATLPPPDRMRATIAAEEARMARRYLASKRHTIQVDHFDYLRLLERERAGTGHGTLARLRQVVAGARG